MRLSDLFEAQNFYFYEVIKVIIIRKNQDLILAIFEIVPLCFKNFNNRQKFAILDFIYSFY